MTDQAPADTPFKIDSILQSTEVNPQGDVIDVYAIRWSNPQLGYFTTNIPAEHFSPQEAHSIIQEKANTLSALFAHNLATHPMAG